MIHRAMSAVPARINDLTILLGLDQPTPLVIRREAARELCAEILDNLAATSRAQEFSERAAFILYGDSSNATPVSLRATAHRLCQFVAAGLPT
jgi:hypothetical protein